MVEEEEKDKEIEEIKEEPKKRNMLKIFAGIGILLVIVFSIIAGLQENISWKYPTIIGGILILVGLIFFFLFDIYNLFKKTKKEKDDAKKVPEPMSEEELKEVLGKALTNEQYGDHIKEWDDKLVLNIRDNLIYCFKVYSLYGDRPSFLVINANYPKREHTVFYNKKVTSRELKDKINSASTHPLASPDIETSQVFNPLTGGFLTTRKRTYRKPVQIVKPKENLM